MNPARAHRFGNYEVLYEIKSGGMGSVLLARRRGPGAFEQLVAIKTILSEHASTPAPRAMFLDEAALLARLVHPGIASVFDFGEEQGALYMVMEYVAGIPFRDLVELRPPPSIAARAIAEACRGVHAAHELRDLHGQLLGVVHRDISPDNLMLGFDGHVKVIDFGIALNKKRSAPVTEFGTVKGKPPYMSPEQVKNATTDRRSDVFSLAVVLHELLVGRPLFGGDSIYAIALAVTEQPIEPPSQLVPGGVLPPGLDDAVLAALARDRAQRTPTAAALAEQLDQAVQAAGGESLAAWAERELEQQRAAHRAWLARVTSGKASEPRMVGRPTNEVTEIAEAPRPLKSVSGEIAEHDEPSRGGGALRSAAVALVIMLVVVGLGVGLYIASGHHGHPARRADARLVAEHADGAALVVARADAALDDAPAATPPLAIDAGHRRADAGHARPAPHDAAPAVAAPDAAAPAGYGFVTISSAPGSTFRNIVIDGKPAGPTPMVKQRIRAGRHTIQLLAPDTGDVLVEETVTIEDGKTATVQR